MYSQGTHFLARARRRNPLSARAIMPLTGTSWGSCGRDPTSGAWSLVLAQRRVAAQSNGRNGPLLQMSTARATTWSAGRESPVTGRASDLRSPCASVDFPTLSSSSWVIILLTQPPAQNVPSWLRHIQMERLQHRRWWTWWTRLSHAETVTLRRSGWDWRVDTDSCQKTGRSTRARTLGGRADRGSRLTLYKAPSLTRRLPEM
mmetsp:Transcript_18147/g.48813  ORF Transcript_18147/g.48813 Transcript_18147/m.48813 type:complete len:203 (+) Transcript_18147:422-1030(+)